MSLLPAQYPLKLAAQKADGRAFLNASQYDQALGTYARILMEHPEDVDSYLFMGDCYLAEGDANTALLLYSQALINDPQDETVRKKVRVARQQCLQAWNADSDLRKLDILREETIPSNPDTVAGVMQRMTAAEAPVQEEDVQRASKLLEDIIHNPRPAHIVAQRLQEIDNLVPALLELNIRQAQADGRPDVARLLQHLLANIKAQIAFQDGWDGIHSPALEGSPVTESRKLRALVLGPEDGDAAMTVWMAFNVLARYHIEAELACEVSRECVGQYDLVIALRPHTHPSMMEAILNCAAAKVPVILYLDVDFEKIPLDHPDYEHAGLWSPERAKAYSTALLLADAICVPSQTMADSLRSLGYPVHVVPDGWMPYDEDRGKHPLSRSTLNLGWIGSPGQVEDVSHIRRIILRVLREFPFVNLVISGDPQVFQLFDSIPESRRLYLPVVSPEDQPHLLEQIDILLVPLRNTPFNDSLSDRRLVEASVHGIPWVASPIPAHVAWKAGGLVANTLDEWHTHLRQLIQDSDLRSLLSWTGRELAKTRTPAQLGSLWVEVINDVLKSKG